MPSSTRQRFHKVADILAQALDNHPQDPALVTRDESWSYEEFGQLVSRASEFLKHRGVEAGSRTAIVGANHPAYCVAYFAAQNLASVTVEIAAHESLETLSRVISDTKASFLVTDRSDLLEELQGTVAGESFDAFLAESRAGSKDALPLTPVEVEEDAPASIVFTSGTTGLPKGVLLSHRNFCVVVDAIQDYLELVPEDRYALVLPLSHSYGKSNLLTTVAVGASLVILENFQALPAFLSSLSSLRCTVLSAVPFHANILLRRGNMARYDLSALRILTFSGNHLPHKTIEGLSEALPHVDIFSMYGLTESTTRACFLPPERIREKRGSCGRPIRCVEMRIVDEDGQVLPQGKVGRVELRGPNVMLGYCDEPELTARTITDGWLNTGDLGRLDEEGYLYLEGREKDIIKCAGERVCPQEIEEVLASHPSVGEVAVVGVEDSILGEAVKAFISPASASDDISALRTLCARSLSHHKIPRHLEFVDELPKTITGKILKSRLREGI